MGLAGLHRTLAPDRPPGDSPLPRDAPHGALGWTHIHNHSYRPVAINGRLYCATVLFVFIGSTNLLSSARLCLCRFIWQLLTVRTPAAAPEPGRRHFSFVGRPATCETREFVPCPAQKVKPHFSLGMRLMGHNSREEERQKWARDEHTLAGNNYKVIAGRVGNQSAPLSLAPSSAPPLPPPHPPA